MEDRKHIPEILLPYQILPVKFSKLMTGKNEITNEFVHAFLDAVRVIRSAEVPDKGVMMSDKHCLAILPGTVSEHFHMPRSDRGKMQISDHGQDSGL